MAFEVAGDLALPLVAAQLYGISARIDPDPVTRKQALAKGEASLAQGGLSHNHFVFSDCAIQSSLDAGDWAEADRYCNELELYASTEPVPWVEFLVARERALARVGRGERSAELAAALQALRQQGADADCNVYLASLDAALQQLAGPVA